MNNILRDLKIKHREFIDKGLVLAIENNFLELMALSSVEKFEDKKDRTTIYRDFIKSGFYFYKEWGVLIRFKAGQAGSLDFEEKREIIEELAETSLQRVGV